jgi:hypothetical protein
MALSPLLLAVMLRSMASLTRPSMASLDASLAAARDGCYHPRAGNAGQ